MPRLVGMNDCTALAKSLDSPVEVGTTHCVSPREMEFHEAHMIAACAYAMLSRAERAKVGSVIVKEGAVISFGFNGTPAGWDNRCEDEHGKTYPWVRHAERNAFSKLAKGAGGAKGATIYTSYAPCVECALEMIGAEIAQVVYLVEFKKADGLEYLRKSGIQVLKLSEAFTRRMESVFGVQFRRDWSFPTPDFGPACETHEQR